MKKVFKTSLILLFFLFILKINNVYATEQIDSSLINYTTHVQTYGWLNWSQNGQVSGTTGQAKRMEAIQIKLAGQLANKSGIQYRVHAQTYGWLDWVQNGEISGTTGQAKRMEAIQIQLTGQLAKRI